MPVHLFHLSSSSWMRKSPPARAQSLYSLAKGLEAKRRDVVTVVSIQTGLSMDEAEKEVDLSIASLSDWASYCDKIQGGTLVMTILYTTCYHIMSQMISRPLHRAASLFSAYAEVWLCLLAP